MRRIRRNDRNYCARRFDWSPAGDWPLTRQFGRKMNGIDEEDVARSPMVMSEPRGRPPWSHELGWSVKSVSCRMRARRSRRRCCRPAQLDSIHLPSKRGQSTQNVCTSLRFQVWISEIRRMRNWINGIARNTGTAEWNKRRRRVIDRFTWWCRRVSRPQTAEHSNFSSVTTPRFSRVSINFESIGLATEGHTGTGEMCSNGQMGSSCSINRIVEVKGRGRKRNKLKKTLNFFSAWNTVVVVHPVTALPRFMAALIKFKPQICDDCLELDLTSSWLFISFFGTSYTFISIW